MQNFFATITGKLIRLVLAPRRGGGHALPGLVVETLYPGYVPSMLSKLPGGVVIITGTNGKTTTTKIVAQILHERGIKILTNDTGSNLVRGIASSLVRQASPAGRLKADMAILEIDEATARLLVENIGLKPRWVLALNVSRDQLDRFGEIDTVAAYVGEAMKAATDGVVANADDPQLAKIAQKIAKNKPGIVHYFGFAPKLKEYFPTDYELAAVSKSNSPISRYNLKKTVELADFNGQDVNYKVAGQDYATKLKLSGQHNFLNGAAALALIHRLMPEVQVEDLIADLAAVSLAFGRGEKYRLKDGAEIELVLVKNPASFTQALSSYATKNAHLMIAINDRIADSRDVSWLWDINFQPLAGKKVAITSGSRAADMALRLHYGGINTGMVEQKITKALTNLATLPGDKVILATYTAMLQLYKILSREGIKLP